MQCFVYKGERKPDHYLYLPCELQSASAPRALLDMLGELNLVIEFELKAERQLPQADTRQVLQNLRDQGFYLQMPKKDMLAEEDQWFN